MLGLAFIMGCIVAGPFLLIDGSDNALRKDDSFLASVVTSLFILFGMTGLSYWILWQFTPALYFGNVTGFVYLGAIIAGSFGGIRAAYMAGSHRLSDVKDWRNTHRTFGRPAQVPLGTYAAVLFLVFWFIFCSVHGVFRVGDQKTADYLASRVNVTMEAAGSFPDTDPEHMVKVPEQAAHMKAETALNQANYADTGTLATNYHIYGDGVLQLVNDHMWYVFGLQCDGWRECNRVDRIVPGYISVDAEDPDAVAVAHLDFEMRFTSGGPTSNSIARLIWGKYHGYEADDITLEVDEDGTPFYTATLNRPPTTFIKPLPVKFIVIDPQAPADEAITEYALDEAPPWVDRVHSDDVVKATVAWWGEWGAGKDKAPFRIVGKLKGKSYRYKVAGDPTLVYVGDEENRHAEWQVLLTGWRKKSTVVFVGLYNARSNDLRLYEVDNIKPEDKVSETFDDSLENTRNYDSVDPVLYWIYGRPSWFTSYLTGDEGDDNRSIGAFGLMPADAQAANNVAFSQSWEGVTGDYQELLARGVNAGDDPTGTRDVATKTGTVTAVTSVVIEGTQNFQFIIDGDLRHIYRGRPNGDDLVELPFVEVGSKVSFAYADVKSNRRQLIIIDVASIGLRGPIEDDEVDPGIPAGDSSSETTATTVAAG